MKALRFHDKPTQFPIRQVDGAPLKSILDAVLSRRATAHFKPDPVPLQFGLPVDSEVIALLAVGFAKEPDKPYGGRLALEEFVHEERYGQAWAGGGS